VATAVYALNIPRITHNKYDNTTEIGILFGRVRRVASKILRARASAMARV